MSCLVAFAGKMDGDSWFTLGGLIIYQGKPSISPKRTSILEAVARCSRLARSLWWSLVFMGGGRLGVGDMLFFCVLFGGT